jgi:hypothetical protein
MPPVLDILYARFFLYSLVLACISSIKSIAEGQEVLTEFLIFPYFSKCTAPKGPEELFQRAMQPLPVFTDISKGHGSLCCTSSSFPSRNEILKLQSRVHTRPLMLLMVTALFEMFF